MEFVSASGWLLKKKSITMHGNVNIKTLYLVGFYYTKINDLC